MAEVTIPTNPARIAKKTANVNPIPNSGPMHKKAASAPKKTLTYPNTFNLFSNCMIFYKITNFSDATVFPFTTRLQKYKPELSSALKPVIASLTTMVFTSLPMEL